MFLKRSIISAAVSVSKNLRNKSISLRAFASSSNLKVHSEAKSVATSELLQSLKSEYEAQKELIKEEAEELEPKQVLENFSTFLKENNWTVEHSENSTLVTLKRRDESLQADISLKFDAVEIFNELYDESITEEEEYDHIEENAQENNENGIKNELGNEIDEEMQIVALPFTVEVRRDSITDKALLFDCVLEGDEAENNIVIENVSVLPTDPAVNPQTSFTAPNFSNLDESLQENFEGFVNELVASEELMGFIKGYSVASEAGMYQKWLKNVRSILKH